MLKSEENKIHRKIEETRHRALKIHVVKQRNEERYIQEMRRKQEQEIQILQI